MKRDRNLIMDILQEVESLPDAGTFHDIFVEGRSQAEISEHVRLAHEEGLLEAWDLSSMDGTCWKPARLTTFGHDYLERARAAAGPPSAETQVTQTSLDGTSSALSGSFTYDVAISFAGEQRAEAKAIADCLKNSGVKVFYDEYEDAVMWGKDLYEHLSKVYQEEARYCIILASEAYARKVWTSHERKSAQARALHEKLEYILPVRLDGTQIPGLLSTMSYLDYSKYGSQGICDAFLRKLNKLSVDVTGDVLESCTSSLRALIWNPKTQGMAYIPTMNVRWGSREVLLSLLPDDPTDGPFLNALRGLREEIILGFQNNVAVCRVADLTQNSAQGKDQWELSVRVERTDFSPVMEVNLGNTSADKLAEIRGRRLLLDEKPEQESSDINEVTREVFVSGLESIVRIKHSPFPILFRQYGQEPEKFLAIGWVYAATMLRLSNVVEHVLWLRLSLTRNALEVDFAGTRKQVYQNRSPHEVNIKGTCTLGASS